MPLEDFITPRERVSILMVVALPTEGLLTGFNVDEWTIVERFAMEGEARTRFHRLMQMLFALKGRALLIRETDPGVRNGIVSWRTLVRCNDAETYIEPEDAYEVSGEARASWAAAVETFFAPPVTVKRQSVPWIPAAIAASVAISVGAGVAVYGLRNTDTAPIRVVMDPTDFARRGGVFASFPDPNRAGWYVRLKLNPNGSTEVLDRFHESELVSRRQDGDLAPEADGGLSPRLQGIAAAFRPKT